MEIKKDYQNRFGVSRLIGKRHTDFEGLDKQSQFVEEDADDAASKSENGGCESKAILIF